MREDLASTSARRGLQTSWVLAQKLAQAVVVAAAPTAPGWLVLILGVIVFLVMGVVAGLLLTVSSLSIKASAQEWSAVSDYLTQLDLTFMQQVEELASEQDETYEELEFQVNGEVRERGSLGVYSDVQVYLMYLDYLYTDYNFATVKDEVAKLHGDLHQVEVEAVTGDETTITKAIIKITHTTIRDYFSLPTSVGYDPEVESFVVAAEEAGMMATGVILANPFANLGGLWDISSRFGHRIHPIRGGADRHTGIDIPQAAHTQVQAVLPGVVHIPDYDGDGYGNWVVTTLGNQQIYYAHLISINVTEGQEVQLGDVIGGVGSTGDSTGNHLHLEYREAGVALDPLYLTAGWQ